MMHMPIARNGSQLQSSKPPILIMFLPQEGKSVGLNLKEVERQEENHNIMENFKDNAKMQVARSLYKEMQECACMLII